MRKMIMMALAGFIWRKLQTRVLNKQPTGRTVRR